MQMQIVGLLSLRLNGNSIMSNQRSGNTHKAAANDGMSDMKLRNFFRTAAAICDKDSDAQFYFEQILEHINNGGNLYTDDPAAIRRILGL